MQQLIALNKDYFNHLFNSTTVSIPTFFVLAIAVQGYPNLYPSNLPTSHTFTIMVNWAIKKCHIPHLTHITQIKVYVLCKPNGDENTAKFCLAVQLKATQSAPQKCQQNNHNILKTYF